MNSTLFVYLGGFFAVLRLVFRRVEVLAFRVADETLRVGPVMLFTPVSLFLTFCGKF